MTKRLEMLELRIKMLEEEERKHDLAIRMHDRRLEQHSLIHEQHRAAVQPLLDERHSRTVTIEVSREDAEALAESNYWSVPQLVVEAARKALEANRG